MTVHNLKISIIIVNYNGIEYLKRCIDSILNQQYKNFEIIIVDNCSTDNSLDTLNKNPKLKIIKLKHNSGVSEGHNIGYKHSSGEIIFLLNNDTILKDPKNLNSIFYEFNKLTDIDIMQPPILSYDGTIVDSLGSFFTPLGQLYHHNIRENFNKIERNKYFIFTAKGCAMICRRKVIEKIGLFDGDYFAYNEDLDFCNRAILSGSKIIYNGDLFPINHIGGGTSKKENIAIIYHDLKNKICSFYKNWSLFFFLYFIIILILSQLLTAILTFNLSRLFSLKRAFIWNMKNFKQTHNKKKLIKKIKKVSDYNIVRYYSVFPNLFYFLGLIYGKKFKKESFIIPSRFQIKKNYNTDLNNLNK